VIAKAYGLKEPVFPEPLRLPLSAPGNVRGIAACCNRLLEQAEILGQPSEPLDDRWRDEWAAVLSNLDSLESLIQTSDWHQHDLSRLPLRDARFGPFCRTPNGVKGSVQ